MLPKQQSNNPQFQYGMPHHPFFDFYYQPWPMSFLSMPHYNVYQPPQLKIQQNQCDSNQKIPKADQKQSQEKEKDIQIAKTIVIEECNQKYKQKNVEGNASLLKNKYQTINNKKLSIRCWYYDPNKAPIFNLINHQILTYSKSQKEKIQNSGQNYQFDVQIIKPNIPSANSYEQLFNKQKLKMLTEQAFKTQKRHTRSDRYKNKQEDQSEITKKLFLHHNQLDLEKQQYQIQHYRNKKIKCLPPKQQSHMHPQKNKNVKKIQPPIFSIKNQLNINNNREKKNQPNQNCVLQNTQQKYELKKS